MGVLCCPVVTQLLYIIRIHINTCTNTCIHIHKRIHVVAVDEMTLSFKSTLTGLTKMAGEATPPEAELERLANDAFRKADTNQDDKISKPEFYAYCLREPDVRSWLNYFHDPEDICTDAEEATDLKDVVLECKFPVRSNSNWNAYNQQDFFIGVSVWWVMFASVVIFI